MQVLLGDTGASISGMTYSGEELMRSSELVSPFAWTPQADGPSARSGTATAEAA